LLGAASPAQAFAMLDDKIQAGMAKYQIPGAAVAVLYQGQEHVRGFGVTNVRHPVPVDGDTLFQIGSTTKTFTGTAAMRLVDAGKLDLGGQVQHYLPGFQAPTGAQAVTVRQLLNHSAGWLGDDYYNTGRGSDALPQYVAAMHELPQLTPPGTVFAYNNAAICLAGLVVQQLAGNTYEFAIEDLLLKPLGLRHSFFFADQIIGYNIAAPHYVVNGKPQVIASTWALPRSISAAGAIVSTASDQLTWAKFHLGDGRAPDGTRLLSQASLEAMRTHPGPGGTLFVELTGVGVTWMLRPTAQGIRIVQHGGDTNAEHSGFLMIPEHKFAMTLLTNCASGPQLLNELFTEDWAIRLFTGLTNLPAPERTLSAGQLAPYEGRYTSQTFDTAGRLVDNPPMLMRAAGGGLRITDPQGTTTGFLTFYTSPYGPDYVLVKDASGVPTGPRANFVRDQAGRVAWFRRGGRLNRHQIS
jgi:CubicO group peptidase (beta-lactamase class C family)